MTVSRPQRLARALGVTLIYHFICRFLHRFSCWKGRQLGQPVEEKKIAIQKDIVTACLAGSIHVVPIAASLVVVYLNWRGFYIGEELEGAVGQDDAKLLALQFASKLHELTISASLTAVILSYIRHELTTDSGLPFGAIVAGLQFKDVSYLWSMEFWGAIRASWRRKRDKAVLILLIATCAGLALSAGPSSATLMKPRLDYWPAGGTDFWIALPKEELFSTNASAVQVSASCMNDTGDLSCPSGGWQILAQDYMSLYRSRRLKGYMPDYAHVPGQKAVRALRMFIRATSFQFIETNQTQATVGSSAVADGLVETGRIWAWAAYFVRSHTFLERFWSRVDVVYSVEAQQPIVHARCIDYNLSQYISRSTVPVYDLWDLVEFKNTRDFGTLEYNYTNDEQVSSLVQNVLYGESVPQVAWSTVPQSNGSALGATLTVMTGDNVSKLFQCTIAARMAPGTLQNTRNNISLVTGSDHSSIYDDNNSFAQISIEPAWAAFLNPTISPDGSTAFQYMMQAAGILNDTSDKAADNIVYAIEMILSLSVVNGLARRDFPVGISGTLLGNTDGLDLVNYLDSSADRSETPKWECKDWCHHLVPSGYKMGYGGNAFNISDPEKTASTKLTMRAGAFGWAFNRRGSAAKFAMIALLLYVLIAFGHLLYTIIWTRESSSSWDSISELVALAIRSDPPRALENTGAGIETDGTFEQPTRVICKNQCVQLVVGETMVFYDRVDANVEYG